MPRQAKILLTPSNILYTLSNILRTPSNILRAPSNILCTPSNILPPNILCTPPGLHKEGGPTPQFTTPGSKGRANRVSTTPQVRFTYNIGGVM